MSKYTPGPWAAIPDSREDAEGHWYILTDDEDVIATGLIEQDARLIAAAPDLLAALKLCEPFCKGHQETPEKVARYAAVRAAIAKAEGAS